MVPHVFINMISLPTNRGSDDPMTPAGEVRWNPSLEPAKKLGSVLIFSLPVGKIWSHPRIVSERMVSSHFFILASKDISI